MNEMLIAITQQEFYPFAASVIPGLIGALFGIRSGIGSAKRLEFNATIDPIRERLIASLSSHHPDYGLSAVEVDAIQQRCTFWRWRRIRKALRQYDATKPRYTRDDIGQPELQNAEAIHACNKMMAVNLSRA